jgi:DNA invertase Pin-like site-specific DNA recombinase
MLRPNLPDTERRHVFGYLRLPAVDPMAYAERRQQLEEYADKHGLRLGRVFVDEGYNDEVVSRPGFSQLCILLQLEQPDGVLLLQPEDLSSNEATGMQLARRVWATGVDIYVVHGQAPTAERSSTP